MNSYVALLRAVNVGGTGRLPMQDLRDLCKREGLLEVRTYIASGNVVFRSDRSARQLKQALEAALEKYSGRAIGVQVRTASEMAAVLATNPFLLLPAEPRSTQVIFLDQPPQADLLDSVSGLSDEEIRLGQREIYVYYPSGMARSRLKIRGSESGTARNINTVKKLVEMAGER